MMMQQADAALGQTIRLRFTDVFIRRNNRWVVALSHATRIPD
jgi:hypothetical protein